jgi:hypothetical protein
MRLLEKFDNQINSEKSSKCTENKGGHGEETRPPNHGN